MKKLLIAALVSFALSSHGDTLTRTNWFDSSGMMTATPGHLQMPMTNTPQYWTTYFAPTNSPITLSQPGNQIKVTWTFTAAGVHSGTTTTPLAFGLINTPDTNRLTADAAPGDDAYGGYATFFGDYSGNLFWYYRVAGRTYSSTASALFQENYPGYAGWSIQSSAYNFTTPGANGIPYTLTMTLTRNASNGLDVNSVVAGNSGIVNQGAYTDPAPNTFTFNTASIFSDGNNFGAFDTTGFTVDFFPTSPPAISFQPVSLACFPGNTVAFSSSASGSLPLSYQWTFDGTNIDGETNSSLKLANVQFGQSGNYALLVTNSSGSTVSSNAVLTVNPPPSRVPPPAGLVAWWPADGNALDIAGGNNGTLVHAVGYENGREGGQCFRFNGGNAAVEVGNATNLQLQDFTIETWSQRTYSFISSPNGGPGLLFSFGGGGYGFGINDDGTLVLTKIGVDSIASAVSDGDTGWHHVAITKSGTNVIFYMDGSADAALTYTNQFEFSTPACIGAIGDNSDFPQNTFYGAIDELSIYNRALSGAEIQAIYNSGGGKCQQLPNVTLSVTNTNAMVAWPVWASGFSLQSAANLTPPGDWADITPALQTNGLNLWTALPVSTNRQFFRLAYPLP